MSRATVLLEKIAESDQDDMHGLLTKAGFRETTRRWMREDGQRAYQHPDGTDLHTFPNGEWSHGRRVANRQIALGRGTESLRRHLSRNPRPS